MLALALLVLTVEHAHKMEIHSTVFVLLDFQEQLVKLVRLFYFKSYFFLI